MTAMLIQKFSPGFAIRHSDGAILATKGHSRLYLRQGDIDLGCGIYCALMGLIFCGVISWHQGRNVAGSNRKALVAFWEEASPSFFVGTDGADIARFFKATAPELKVQRFRRSDGATRTKLTAAVELGHFVMARIQNANAVFDHWTVVSGVQGLSGGGKLKFTALLMLDPSQPAPRYSLYNGILELGYGRARHRYARNGEVRHVSLLEALAIHIGRLP